MRVEIGSGERPLPGFYHSDITKQPGVDLDFCGPAWEIPVDDSAALEVVALGVIEHLTYTQAAWTFRNVRRILKDGGSFLFDVPDIEQWCRYLAHPETSPFDQEHVLRTLYGWQRWSGDEHKSGWTLQLVSDFLIEAGFEELDLGVDQFLERGFDRRRMHRPEDAHLYCHAR